MRNDLPLANGIGIAIVLMTLASPIVWHHHLVWLSLPVVIAWTSRKALAARATIFTLSLVLIATVWLDATLDPETPEQLSLAAACAAVTVVASALLCYLLVVISQDDTHLRQTPPLQYGV
jgi:apolipoprotein N-acyltransferase